MHHKRCFISLLCWCIIHSYVRHDNDWLIVWSLTPFSTLFQLSRGSQCTYSCYPGIAFNSTPQFILLKPLAAFPINHYRNNGQQWERNESCCNDYHRSSERILHEPGDRTSDPLFSIPVRYDVPTELLDSAVSMTKVVMKTQRYRLG